MSLTMISHQIISSGELCERPCRTLKTAIGLGEKKDDLHATLPFLFPVRLKMLSVGGLEYDNCFARVSESLENLDW